jgi:DNA-damage-inducible protein D
METRIAVFKGKSIRKTILNNEWWFAVVDVVEVLADSRDSVQYIKKMRSRDPQLQTNWGTICTPLDLIAKDGKIRKVLCANTEGIFRIIQSISSPKAEPFKRWLAKVGYERVQEIEDPELGQRRTRALYKAKGYSEDWIEKRMRGIAIREELTDQWKKHGVERDKEYEILTAEISKATTEITRVEDPLGFDHNREVSKRGGRIAGGAREKLEKETGEKVVSPTNYLNETQKAKKLKK